MSYHTWLSSTPKHQPTFSRVDDPASQASIMPIGTGQWSGTVQGNRPHHQGLQSPPNSLTSCDISKMHPASHSNSPDGRHATTGFAFPSPVEHPATSFPPQHCPPMHSFTQYPAIPQPSAGNDLVSENSRPNQQDPKRYSSTGVRSHAKPQQKLPSLAATHPAKYCQKPSNTMLPSPPSSPPCSADRVLPPSAEIPPTQLPTPAPEEPWPVYTDPMLQTSSDPHFWGTNCTILRADRKIEPGNVISPTAMVGLPCGGMIEMTLPCHLEET